ncbi:MAG TPA: hypothetical protein VEC99_05670, partial [Clostridia bacterium]|nr:hypothetical protein [Clostridia bacterium]
IAGDVQVATVAVSLGTMGSSLGSSGVRSLGNAVENGYNRARSSPLGRKIRAYQYSGWECARDIFEQKVMGRSAAQILERHGIVLEESSSIHAAMLAGRAQGKEIVQKIRSKPLDTIAQRVKNKYRAWYVRQGYQQKRAIDWAAKSRRDALLKSPVDGQTVVSDLDSWSIEVNGKLATSKEDGWFHGTANRDYRARVAPTRTPNPMFQHHGQAQVAEGYGKNYLGHTLDYEKLKAINHPGHTVTIRLDSKGNLLAYRTPAWQIDAEIKRVDVALKARRAELGRMFLFPGLPPSWFVWQ